MSIMYAGVIAAMAMIFLLLKLDLKKVLGYDVLVDIIFTALLCYMLAGTFSGMMSALLGGAVLSIFLFAVKKFIGYKQLVIQDKRLVWKEF